MTQIEVVRPGLLTTVQDRGRPGLAHLGVPPSGAADATAYDLGNRLVGNPPGAAALEATMAGPVLRFDVPTTIALTGATTAEVRTVEVLEVGRCVGGVRMYICVRGGIDVEPTLGSRSTDLLTGLGPRPLQTGDVLRIGVDTGPERAAHVGTVPTRVVPDEPVLRVRLGPRDEWFTAAAIDALCSERWSVSSSSNRVGIRLEGPSLERARHDELLSEGLVTGAIQVPASGQPILLMHDHPTTGGYPVIAIVRSDDLWLAGQLAPRQRVRFVIDG
ncbi:MAG TPA: biotin-dependent carboxyltransferase family protein [Gaiellaceae bacterium]